MDFERIEVVGTSGESLGKRLSDLDVTGPRNTLEKIAQSQPGTPLELTGWYAQRDGEFRLEKVRIVGFE